MQLDGLTLFGLLSLSAMLVFYALEHRSHWYVLAMAGACIAASVYGFLQGAWPFGVLELIWAGIASKRWLALKQRRRWPETTETAEAARAQASRRSRTSG
ncbi:MAG TPA: hypothetical protein VMS10_06350 [Methyloceanibacter sp.]|nr:hypothetical protein [Methyloceanibacter sp.]